MYFTIGFLVLALCGLAYYVYHLRHLLTKGERAPIYKVTVKLAGGHVTKLTLNQELYGSFAAWTMRSEGLFELENDTAYVALDRKYVAGVEVKKR